MRGSNLAIMAKPILLPACEHRTPTPLTMEELEFGLLDSSDGGFQDTHVEAFRETVIEAARLACSRTSATSPTSTSRAVAAVRPIHSTS